MKNILLVITAFVLVLIGVFYLVPRNSEQIAGTDKNEITLEKINDDIKNGALLIDVRTPQEYTESHAKGSINLSIEEIQKGARPKAAKDKTIYLYCRTGRRAGIVEIILKDDGYKNVINLKSLDKWKALGGEVIK